MEPNVLITRDDHSFISDMASRNHKTIALQRGTAMSEFFAQDLPNLTLIDTESEPAAMQRVSDGKADLTLRSLIVATRTIKMPVGTTLKYRDSSQDTIPSLE